MGMVDISISARQTPLYICIVDMSLHKKDTHLKLGYHCVFSQIDKNVPGV